MELFCRRNRNPGTGCTCRPGQPGVHSLGNYQLTKESPQLAVELASRAAEGAKELFAGELKVSVIIPSKDNPEVLEKCLRSLTRRSEGRLPVEILLVDNGSSAENKQKRKI